MRLTQWRFACGMGERKNGTKGGWEGYRNEEIMILGGKSIDITMQKHSFQAVITMLLLLKNYAFAML